MQALSPRTCWIWTALFAITMLLLWSFFLWLRLSPLTQALDHRDRQRSQTESLAEEQAALLTPELTALFEDYSDGMRGLASLFAARDEVFSGALDDDHEDPVLLLDVIDFLGRFKRLIGKDSVLTNFDLNAAGQLSFVVETSSYYQASQQMEVLRFGFEEEPLLSDVEITSVGRQVLGEGIAPVYRFLVQAQISPAYYEYQQVVAEEAVEELSE